MQQDDVNEESRISPIFWSLFARSLSRFPVDPAEVLEKTLYQEILRNVQGEKREKTKAFFSNCACI
jgi:hypothetical protein